MSDYVQVSVSVCESATVHMGVCVFLCTRVCACGFVQGLSVTKYGGFKNLFISNLFNLKLIRNNF